MSARDGWRLVRAAHGVWPAVAGLVLLTAICLLGACSSAPAERAASGSDAAQVVATNPLVAASRAAPDALHAGAVAHEKSRWSAVAWDTLPGFAQDDLTDAWNAWLKSCERAAPVWRAACSQVRLLSIGDTAQKRAWLQENLQPFLVEPVSAASSGALLTGYFEPEFDARRVADEQFKVPLYRLPSGLNQRQPWYSRQEMDSLASAKAALQGQEIAYLADPVQAMLMQIQGSGRLRLREPDGQSRLLRLSFAGHNGHAYQSIGRWLLEQGALRDASWPGIQAWLAQHPQRQQELLWRNPRVVFFQEQALSDLAAEFGPPGALGVALTPGRSVAVDPLSIPLGTPLWLVSQGSSENLQRLVLAQDTGSAITGALRADLFTGWGADAGKLAGQLKQPLKLWVLWPKEP